MKKIFFGLIILGFIGCSSQKTLLKGDIVYQYSAPAGIAGPVPSFTPYRVIERKKVTIVDNSTYLIIQDNPASDPRHYSAGTIVAFPGPVAAAWKPGSAGSAYFNESAAGVGKQFIWYKDGKFVLQTATLPVKIRSEYKDIPNNDNYPSQVETGFNIGFLSGYKFTWNRFRSTNNFLGLPTDKYSVTIGGLFSLGGTDLNTNTTRPKIAVARKTAMISYGTAIVFGFQSLNFGYAIGWDQGIGPKAESWIYKGRLWNGIIISLDLIK